MKKILGIIFIIIFVLVLGLAAYFGIKGKNNPTDTTGGSGITFREFFPFGQKEPEPEPNPNTGNNTDPEPVRGNNNGGPEVKPKIRKIYAGPVAGIIAIEKPRVDEADPNAVILFSAVRSANRITGNIVDIFPDTNQNVVASSRAIPQIQEALFGPLGSSVVLRYLSPDLETAESFAASFIPGASAENALKGSFLPENLLSITVDEQNGKIFYIQNFDGSASGSTSDTDGGNKKSIFSHPFSEWNTDFITPTKLLFITKPSGFVPGYSYIFNTQTNIFEKLVGGINGLIVLPNKTGDRFLIGEGNADGMKISWYDSVTSKTQGTNIYTMPEKCIWSNDKDVVYCGVPVNPGKGAFPDVWYQGQTSFIDTIEKYNLKDGTKEIIGFPSEQVDLVNPTLSKNEDHLFFINKRDGAVWVVDLK